MGSIEGRNNEVSEGKTTMHRLIAEEGAVLMPGVQDAFSAAIAAKAGFKACFVSGFGVSAALLGLPDFGLLTYISSFLSLLLVFFMWNRILVYDKLNSFSYMYN